MERIENLTKSAKIWMVSQVSLLAISIRAGKTVRLRIVKRQKYMKRWDNWQFVIGKTVSFFNINLTIIKIVKLLTSENGFRMVFNSIKIVEHFFFYSCRYSADVTTNSSWGGVTNSGNWCHKTIITSENHEKMAKNWIIGVTRFSEGRLPLGRTLKHVIEFWKFTTR